MNSKQAKALRAGLREFAKVANPERKAEYKAIEHVKIVTDEKGERHEVPYARTAVLSPTSPRGLYQRAKRGISSGGLSFKSGGLHRNRLRARVNQIVGLDVRAPGRIAPPERERSDRVVGITTGSQT